MGMKWTFTPTRVVPRAQKPQRPKPKALSPEQAREAFLKEAESHRCFIGWPAENIIVTFADGHGNGAGVEFKDDALWVYASTFDQTPDPYEAHFHNWETDGHLAQKLTPTGWGFRLERTQETFWFHRAEAFHYLDNGKFPMLHSTEPQPYPDSVLTARIWQENNNIHTVTAFTPPDVDDFG